MGKTILFVIRECWLWCVSEYHCKRLTRHAVRYVHHRDILTKMTSEAKEKL